MTLICSPIRTRRFEASEKSINGSSHRIADDNGSLTTFPRIKVRPKKEVLSLKPVSALKQDPDETFFIQFKKHEQVKLLPSNSKVTFLLVSFGRITLSLLLARLTYFKFDELNPHKSLFDSNEDICEFLSDKDSRTGKSGKPLEI